MSTAGDPPPDPFAEWTTPRLQLCADLLGARFHFHTDSPELLRIARHAYAGLPAQRFANQRAEFHVKLVLTPPVKGGRKPRAPGITRPVSGGGLLCGVVDGSAMVTVDPGSRHALMVIPRAMLRFPYHVRYELLEFAVYMLAARAQNLVPLHAACVGRGGTGVLLLGASGSGKSTLALHCLLAGLDFLAEDSVLVRPRGLLATGVANFLHIRPGSRRFVSGARGVHLAASPRIRRRSGIEKLEIDLRRPSYYLAAAPLRLAALVVLSAEDAAPGRPLLRRLGGRDTARQLADGQAYAAGQPGWREFRAAAVRLPAYELHRGAHPQEGAAAVATLLRTGKSR